MFKNRFLIVLGVLSLLLVAMVISFPLSNPPTSAERGRAADATRWEAMGQYYANQATAASYQSLKEAQPYIMDSATRSYIAQGMAILAARNKIDSATQSDIAQGKAILAERNAVDSATQSYIAWGKALQAAGKLGVSGTCSTASQENIFAGIPNNLDSATRSYMAWGLALQAKNDIGALCR